MRCFVVVCGPSKSSSLKHPNHPQVVCVCVFTESICQKSSINVFGVFGFRNLGTLRGNVILGRYDTCFCLFDAWKK